jgi:hypothetical protein
MSNRIYVGEIRHRNEHHTGSSGHAIVAQLCRLPAIENSDRAAETTHDFKKCTDAGPSF